MREKDLRAKFKQIDPDQVPGGLPMIRILEEACVDLHRIADALEEANWDKVPEHLDTHDNEPPPYPFGYRSPSRSNVPDDDIPF